MMNVTNKWTVGLIFALLQLAGNAFLGGHKFLDGNLDVVVYFLLLFLSVFSFVALFYSVADKQSTIKLGLIIRIVSFPIAGMSTGLLLYSLFRGENSNLGVYLVSFLLISLPGAIWSLLQSLFEEADDRISQMVQAKVASSKNSIEDTKEVMFHLENENGKLLLEVPVSRIICYEANDNYVLTHYKEIDGSIKRSMERISLRKIEQLLADERIHFLRVHKSFLVNPEFVSDVKGRSQAYKLQLKEFDQLIPVSRSYDISLLGLK